MTMDLDTLKAWATFALALWNVALTFAVWLRKPGHDAQEALVAHRAASDQRMALIENDLSGIRGRLDFMTTSEELARLEGVVRQLDERTKGQSDTMDTVRHQLNRIESYLLQERR